MKYVTGKREKILGFLCANPDSTYALEEICKAVLGEAGGKSTVYRIVAELVNEGSLRRVSDGKSRRFLYQYIGDEHCHNHLHLKCKGCGRLIHMDDVISRELERRVMNAGFVIEEGTLLFGTCLKCIGGGEYA